MAGNNVGEAPSSLMDYISKMDNRLSHRSKLEYTTRLKEISKKIQIDTGELTPELLVNKLASLAANSEIAPATYRIYKSAIMYWLGQQAQALIASGGEYSEYAKAFDALRDISHAHLSARSAVRTSSRKLKHFPQECADKLAEYASQFGYRAPNAVRADAFVKANLLVGLRPVEWFDVSFASYFVRDEQGNIVRDEHGRTRFEHMMIVDNAKATHGRGNGKRRELVLHDITANELKALVHFREIALKFRERHRSETDMKRLTNLLYRPINNMISRALAASGYAGRDIPSCYSTRHQVTADFKASKINDRMIAAFFGHSSVKTHKEHYGYKKHGSGGVRFRPTVESLAAVSDRGLAQRAEVMSPQMAAEVDQWISEQESRKSPSAR